MENKPDNSEDNAPVSAQGVLTMQRPITGADRLLVPLAVLLGYIMVWSAGLGLGFAVFVIAGIVIYILYGRGSARLELRSGMWMLACLSVLAMTYAAYSGEIMKVLGLPFIVILASAWALTVSGTAQHSWKSPGFLQDLIESMVLFPFIGLGKPFRAVVSMVKNKRASFWAKLAIGVICALPAAIVVLSLLSSADELFGALTRRIAGMFTDYVEITMMRAALSVFFGVFIYSIFYNMKNSWRGEGYKKAESGSRPVSFDRVACISFLSVFAVIYAVFIGTQFTYLFYAATGLRPDGMSYAEYARQGFFQLTAVAGINIALILAAAQLSPPKKEGDRVYKGLLTALCALTAGMLVSALARMLLYVSVYGLSMLRIFTLWAMVIIGILLWGVCVKIYRGGFKFFRLFAMTMCIGFTIFSAACPEKIVAEYNVSAYLSGAIAEIDDAYLASLSADAMPALQRLADRAGENIGRSGKKLSDTSRQRRERLHIEGYSDWNLTEAILILNNKK